MGSPKSAYICFRMKRYLASLWLVLYVVLTIGITLQTHYCMGRVKYVSLYAAKECPPTCAKTCCHNEATTIRLTDAHVSSSFALIPLRLLPQPMAVFSGINTHCIPSAPIGETANHPAPPPRFAQQPRYICFAQLLLYA